MNDGPSPRTATIAVQLYTLRSREAPFGTLLDIVARAGASAVETVGRHGLEAAAMRDALAEHGLLALSSHVQLADLDADLDGEIAFAREVGIERLVVPSIPGDQQPGDAAGWRALGERLARLGAHCRAGGVTLAYHNHDFELSSVDGRTGLDWLFSAADPSDLEAELDLAWLQRGGRDPLEALRSWGSRTHLVHAKDLAPTGEAEDEGGWAAVGQGTMPWPELIAEGRSQGVSGWIVEHDKPLDPEAAVRTGCAYLASSLEARNTPG